MSDSRSIRVYFDTSVFGGVFDDEFAAASQAAFDQVRSGRFLLLLGATTAEELASAPDRVRTFLAELDPAHIEPCSTTDEVSSLREAYLAAGVLSRKWVDDATHVAAATVHRAQLLLSWNFKHLVHWQRERGFNAVNLRLGYQQVSISSPLEVSSDDEDI